MRAFQLINTVQALCDESSQAFGLYKNVLVVTPDGPVHVAEIVNDGSALFVMLGELVDEHG